jgi:hypothetical protein
MTLERHPESSSPHHKPLPSHKVWRRALERLQFERNEELLANSQALYERLYSDSVAEGHPALRRHREDNILPGLAFYQALLNMGYDKQAVLSLVRALFIEVTRPNRRFFEFLGRTPLVYNLTRWGVRHFMGSNFPPEGWQVEWLEISSERVAFNIHSCFYVDTLNRYGAPELVPIYCDLDDYIYADVSPHMRWDRTKTIGRGDMYCDFCFTRVKSVG